MAHDPTPIRLSTLVSPHEGLVSTELPNSLRITQHIVVDIAHGLGGDALHQQARTFFETVPWVRFAEADSLDGTLDVLDDTVEARHLGVLHVLLGGDEDQLRFRVYAGEKVGIYEVPIDLAAMASRILPRHIFPIYRREAPKCLNETTPIVLHGCSNGAHDGLITTIWYAFGHVAPLYMPTSPLSYSLAGPEIYAAGSGNGAAPILRRIHWDTLR